MATVDTAAIEKSYTFSSWLFVNSKKVCKISEGKLTGMQTTPQFVQNRVVASAASTLVSTKIGFAAIAAAYTWLTFGYVAVTFFLMFVAAAYSTWGGFILASPRQTPEAQQSRTSSTFNIVLGVIVIASILAMFYDRTLLRGIDYANLGIAGARAEFNSQGERGGVWSVLGNIFSAIVYLPLINLIMDWENWDRRRYVVAGLVVLGLLGLTLITGGRTVLLISVAMTMSAILARGASRLPSLPSFLTIGRVILLSLFVLVVFGLIFALRAQTFGAADAADYLSDLCIHLAQPAVEIVVRCPAIPFNTGVHMVNEVANYSIAVAQYAFHVSWVSEAVLGDRNLGDTTAFAGIQQMFLGRFGYQIEATDYDGYFIPASVSLEYDYHVLVALVAFAVLGIILRLGLTSMLNGKYYRGRVVFCYISSAFLISLLINPLNLPVFVLSILAISVVASVDFARRSLGIGVRVSPRANLSKPV